ncbi:MAG: HDOD domain-containing protein [Desulfobulbaceae bacterium]|nr:HDOD domain-containing protein [Desulfobulbaceae bacterium]
MIPVALCRDLFLINTALLRAEGNPMAFNIDEQINFLKKIDFFENFDDHELRQFLSVTKWLKVAAETVLIRENTNERVFYILIKGEVMVFKTLEDGIHAVQLTTLQSGACFGEMSLVMDVKRTAGVITRSDCFLLMVEPEIINSSNVFLQLKFYKRFCEILVSRLIVANERMTSIDVVPPAGRLIVVKLPKDSLDINKPKLKPTSTPTPTSAPTSTTSFVTENQKMELPPLPAKKERGVVRAFQRQLTAALELPYNRLVGNRILPLLAGESENTLRLADLVQMDPALSWKIMQVANSSFYRRSVPIATVPHAMITVGIKNIQSILSEYIGIKQRRKAFSGHKEVGRSFWRHSTMVARIAALLRDVLRLNMSSDIYLAGLFHDIGILALDIVEPCFYPHLSDPHSELCADLHAAEINYISIDHGQAGALLGESIGLPESYIDVMRFHHAPIAARTNQLSVALIHLADAFAIQHGVGHCPGTGAEIVAPIGESYAWAIIQEHHRPFSDINVTEFINTFNSELSKTWSSLSDGLTFS